MKNILLILPVIVLMGFQLVLHQPLPVHAGQQSPSDILNGVGQGLGQTNPTPLPLVIANIIRVILGLLGTLAVIYIIWGGFKWMTSGGDSTKVGDARKMIISAVIGLLIILASYSITEFVLNSLLTATGAQTQ